MRALSSIELLDVWEQGQDRSLTRRALLLLATACPDTPAERLAELSIGQRDARLLRLRKLMFGSRLDCLLACPQCHERLELTFDVANIQPPQEDPDGGQDGAEQDGNQGRHGDSVLSLTADNYQVQFRPPNSLDLLAATEGAGGDQARRLLLERCLLAIQRDQQAQSPDALPAGVVQAVVEQMAQADPLANIQLDVGCPSCGHRWPATFDIVSFFWNELDAWARRILYDVHVLAWAYGWRERDILAMSARRRQFYLEMVRG